MFDTWKLEELCHNHTASSADVPELSPADCLLSWGDFIITQRWLLPSALVTTITLFIFIKIISPYDYTSGLDKRQYSKKRQDMANLSRKLRQVGENLPPPYPDGWFGILESSQLGASKAQQVECFGVQLLAIRNESGMVTVMDAYCPHLGANMAEGKVINNCLECPFHKWRFSLDTGSCVAIPGIQTIPPGSSVHIWESCEVNGMVFVWHHSGKEPPLWELPSVQEIDDGDWTFMGRNDFLIACHLQDIPENGADINHLNSLHKDHVLAGGGLQSNQKWNILGEHVWCGQWAPTSIPHEASVTLRHDIQLFGKYNIGGVDVTARQIGPSYVHLNLTFPFGRIVILQTVLPQGPLLQRVIHRLYAPPRFLLLARPIMWAETMMFMRDVAIWNKKRYLSTPVLVKTDRSIKAYRNFFKQFYTQNSISFEEAVTNCGAATPMDW